MKICLKKDFVKLKWFNGYQRHKYMIIDDFRKYPQGGKDLLGIKDRYLYTVKNKGGHVKMLARKIRFTSYYNHMTCFEYKINANILFKPLILSSGLRKNMCINTLN